MKTLIQLVMQAKSLLEAVEASREDRTCPICGKHSLVGKSDHRPGCELAEWREDLKKVL